MVDNTVVIHDEKDHLIMYMTTYMGYSTPISNFWGHGRYHDNTLELILFR